MCNHPGVEITEDGGCEGCLYMKALAYLLQHATGTGRLVLKQDELEEIGEPELILMTLKRNK